MAKGAFLQLGDIETLPKEDVYDVFDTRKLSIKATKLLNKNLQITISFESPAGIFQDLDIPEETMQRICWPAMQPPIPNPPSTTNHIFFRASPNDDINDNLKDWNIFAKKPTDDAPDATLILRLSFSGGKVNGALSS